VRQQADTDADAAAPAGRPAVDAGVAVVGVALTVGLEDVLSRWCHLAPEGDVSHPQYQLRQRGSLICLITPFISVRSQTSANLPSSTR
jgi:hypothetical protein